MQTKLWSRLNEKGFKGKFDVLINPATVAMIAEGKLTLKGNYEENCKRQ